MKTGTIKFFNNAKGFGFIKVDETEEEIFIHVTGLIDQVREADKVSFEVRDGKRGVNAFNVKKID
jgi:CspA family cold shock protein